MENEEKKILGIYFFFVIFPVAGTKKKNVVQKPFLGYCPIVMEKKKICIASLAIVLQERGLEKKIVVKIVLQYLFCIAERKA